ncbi:MAG: thioredoxin domain-containing protein [Chitinophagales bacterium]|nr:thioredoxin [Chitinophagales bacterium]MCO5279747.1 thioredoxin domain-containing protein [Chitinophagales bacterium]OJV24369.1 MAG: hypothetical protein BGO32_13050 [Bacteroidetes bacterium 37-13]HRN93250.1 thioredoxin domain-containing protein [Chitinophagales bacterium]HRP40298.1 thioredoxin domain-containing protein [Chitinophagales bacterium]
MKNIIPFALSLLLLVACGNSGQKVNNLSANDFEKQISTAGIQLVDVRTPQEFAERHIANAENIDINQSNFKELLSELDKDEPLYLYCLSGGRSSSAAQIAIAEGFKNVYNLEGGILSWTNAGMPVQSGTAETKSHSMSQEEYLKSINKEKLVLVDFNAVWCGPCKILKPIVEKVVTANANTVELLEIDVDKNSKVADYMNVVGIPLLVLYKQGKEVWRSTGLIEEPELLEAIAKAK